MFQRLIFLSVSLLLSFQLQGCTSTQSQSRLLVKCDDPRPEICTLQYTPVCGHSDKAIKTYSNGCAACADPLVIGYFNGACP